MIGLVLLGGLSSRMASLGCKGFLEWNHQPLYMHILNQLRQTAECNQLAISLRKSQLEQFIATLPSKSTETLTHQLDEIQSNPSIHSVSIPIRFSTSPTSVSSASSSSSLPTCSLDVELIFDRSEYADIGPASGLLSAFETHPNATFFIVAVDFPIAPLKAYINLLKYWNQNHTPQAQQLSTSTHSSSSVNGSSTNNNNTANNSNLPLCCYLHDDGNPEPLFAIWSSHALQELKRNSIEKKKTGPCFTLKQILKQYNQGSIGMNQDTSKAESVTSESSGKEKVTSNELEKESKKHEKKEKSCHHELANSSMVGYVMPESETWLFNTNTPEHWKEAADRFKTPTA